MLARAKQAVVSTYEFEKQYPKVEVKTHGKCANFVLMPMQMLHSEISQEGGS